MIISKQSVIKTVLKYYFPAPARTRELDGDEKIWKAWEVYFGSLFCWERKDLTKMSAKPGVQVWEP